MSLAGASENLNFGNILRRVILSWLFSAVIQYISLPAELKSLTELRAITRMSPILTLVLTASGVLLLTTLSFRFKTAAAERTGILVCFAVLAGASLFWTFSIPYFLACILITVILTVYALKGADTPYTDPKPAGVSRTSAILTAVFALIFFAFVSAWTVCRVYSFSAPTFDFGIFTQMFHSMRTVGAPVTTLERDGALSHFMVHMSPIYYLMLPFYAFFPSPSTLQVLQAAVIASSVIPFYLIAKRRGLSGLERVLAAIVLLLYPTLSGGTSYDLHENCFLAPLILWMLYAFEIGNRPLLAVFAVLTLTVKEDAAVYVAVTALFITVSALVRCRDDRKRRLSDSVGGILLFTLSLVYFLCVTAFLERVGDGVMTNRYSNFMYDGSSSLVTVVKSVILSPLKAVFECVDAQKLDFMALTLVPLLGMPIFTRKYERYILLIPYILINLMSDYQYQHSIFFQYAFGSSVLLIYVSLLNLSDIRAALKNKSAHTVLLSSSAILCAAVFSLSVFPKAQPYIERYTAGRQEYSEIQKVLDTVPDGVSVAATTFYTVPLSDRAVLYDIKHSSKDNVLSCEYIVLGLTDTSPFKKYETRAKNGLDSFLELLDREGYTEVGGIDEVIVIYRKISE